MASPAVVDVCVWSMQLGRLISQSFKTWFSSTTIMKASGLRYARKNKRGDRCLSKTWFHEQKRKSLPTGAGYPSVVVGSLSLSTSDVHDSILCPSRSDSRLCGARFSLQGDLPRTGKLVGALAKRSGSIGLPAVGVAGCFGHCESSSVKTAGI